ncbi:MAG: alpha-1,2-fucosyltransferase [bacterium]
MIVVRLMGGMGNQMFQYAVGKQLALKRGVELKLDLGFLLDRTPRKNFVFRNYDLDLFNVDVQIADKDDALDYKYYDSVIVRKLVNLKTRLFNNKYKVVEEKNFHFDSTILNLTDNSYLIGHWQSYRYFENIADIIKKDFCFKNNLGEKAFELSQKIKAENSICLNVRRGDYINIPQANQHHGVCAMDYFNQAVEFMNSEVDNPQYYIFSDDIAWCRENFKLEAPSFFVDHQYKEDRFSGYLQLMKSCQHFIIPNSTFAWWAAWLSEYQDKVVVAPKKWFNNPKINTQDLIPSDWIRI